DWYTSQPMSVNPGKSIMDTIQTINANIAAVRKLPVPTRDQLKHLMELHGEKVKILENMILAQQVTIETLQLNSTNTKPAKEQETDSSLDEETDMEDAPQPNPVPTTHNKKKTTDKEDTVRLHVETSADFRAKTSYLETEKIPFHTYQLKEDKHLKVVIKGIPTEISESEIPEDLILKKLSALRVTRMHRRLNSQKIPLNCVFVQLPRTDQGKQIFGITSTLYLRRRTIQTPEYFQVAQSCLVPPTAIKRRKKTNQNPQQLLPRSLDKMNHQD
ncbi:hypothetical protein CBL_21122, partial [Carabus blaptoides fortunei]